MQRARLVMLAAAVMWSGLASPASAQRGRRNYSSMLQNVMKAQAAQAKALQEAAAKEAAARAAAEAHRKEMHHQAGEARRESAKASGKREAERRAEDVKKLHGTSSGGSAKSSTKTAGGLSSKT
ncbi:MAG TPA: hypothetical protein VFG20_21530 [Planctomycetaceae bacterium]|nr:hypothetical protein [Planctomycetaceae bacterium]